MIETLRNKEIFELYYSIGSKRSLSKLRDKLLSLESPSNVPSLKTLKRWSKAFNWQKRIEQRDIEIGNKLEKKTNKIVLNTKADYRKEIQNSMKVLKGAIRTAFTKGIDGKLKLNIAVTSINDLNQIINSTEKLIKLDMDLIGEGIVESKDTKLTIEIVRVPKNEDTNTGKV